ncbi:MAG: phage portal protein [Desulfovibrio sp.]|nr:phage portal protein [Desulfovibrio sp.]|tara:strand:+ start:36655 stop:38178 length:1524 start_codon:yes stop_codon:yes gene_type:complete
MSITSYLRKKWNQIPFVRSSHAANRVRYAAAQLNHMTGGWLPAGTNVNELINQASPLVRNRARQLVRDFPPFAKATNALVRFIIGEGIQFQSRVIDGDGNPDVKSRTAIEDALKRFADECDVSGSPALRMNLNEIQQLAKRSEIEGGEKLVLRRPHYDQRNKFLPWGLQVIETDRLTDHGARCLKTNALSNGVEYDPRNGRIVAVHVGDEGMGAKKPARVLAENIHYGFDRQRAGQLRGMTLFAPALILANNLATALEAKMDRFKLLSKWMAFVTTPDVAGFQGQRAGSQQTQSGKPIEELENGIIEYLRPGEQVEFASMPSGTGDELAFAMFLLRLVSMTTDLPFEILTSDYSGLNYTTLRVGRNDFRQQMKPVQRREVYQLTKPVTESVIESAVLHGRTSLPGYWSNPWHYRRGVYIPPGLEPLDPQREFKAAVEAIKAGLKSPQQCILDWGGDPEQVLDDIAAWKVLCENRGLSFDLSSISTAKANNPAALDNESQGSKSRMVE